VLSDHFKFIATILGRATRPPWLTVFAGLQALALCVTAAHYHVGLDGLTDSEGQVVTGDFPAFYTAGHLVASGQAARLYDLDLQQRTQSALLGRGADTWQPFAYPPLYALALAPLSSFGGLGAFRLHVFAMFLALAAGLWALGPALPTLSGNAVSWSTTALLVLSFSPLFRTIVGGQNTALTLALMMGAMGALARGRPLQAGLWIGLTSYKPQLLPLLLLWLALSRRWRALFGAAAVCLVHYGLGALWLGPTWPQALLKALVSYQSLEAHDNLTTHISAPAVLRHLLGETGGWTVAALVLVVLIARIAKSARGGADARHGLAVALLSAMLASPHMQYYDVAVATLPVLVAVDARLAGGGTLTLGERALLTAGYLLYPIYTFGSALGFQPLVLWLVLPLIWLGPIERGTTSNAM
jgi:hypothetical protein